MRVIVRSTLCKKINMLEDIIDTAPYSTVHPMVQKIQ